EIMIMSPPKMLSSFFAEHPKNAREMNLKLSSHGPHQREPHRRSDSLRQPLLLEGKGSEELPANPCQMEYFRLHSLLHLQDASVQSQTRSKVSFGVNDSHGDFPPDQLSAVLSLLVLAQSVIERVKHRVLVLIQQAQHLVLDLPSLSHKPVSAFV